MRPEEGFVTASIISTVVVLPAPFGPKRPKQRPQWQVNSIHCLHLIKCLNFALRMNPWSDRPSLQKTPQYWTFPRDDQKKEVKSSPFSKRVNVWYFLSKLTIGVNRLWAKKKRQRVSARCSLIFKQFNHDVNQRLKNSTWDFETTYEGKNTGSSVPKNEYNGFSSIRGRILDQYPDEADKSETRFCDRSKEPPEDFEFSKTMGL